VSLLFNDTTPDYLFLASTPVTAYPFSVSGWIYCDDDATALAIYSIGDASDSGHVHSVFAEGSVAGDPFRIYSKAGGGTLTSSTTTGYTINTWHHFCAVFASATERSIFIDGGSKGTNTTDATPSGLDQQGIACQARAGSRFNPFSGRISELTLWNVALTDAEVASLAAMIYPSRIRPSGLELYKKMFRTEDVDRIGGTSWSTTGSPVAAEHPRIIRVFPSRLWTPSGGGGPILKTASDTLGIRSSELPALKVTLTSSDSIRIAPLEESLIYATLDAIDSLKVALSESNVMSVTISSSDQNRLGVIEDSMTNVFVLTSDDAVVRLDESRVITVSSDASDSTRIGLSELPMAAVSFGTADSVALHLLEAYELLAGVTLKTGSELLTIGLIEQATIFGSQQVSDDLVAGLLEQPMINVSMDVTDDLAVRITDGLQSVVVSIVSSDPVPAETIEAVQTEVAVLSGDSVEAILNDVLGLIAVELQVADSDALILVETSSAVNLSGVTGLTKMVTSTVLLSPKDFDATSLTDLDAKMLSAGD